jgi:hypothetical protein
LKLLVVVVLAVLLMVAVLVAVDMLKLLRLQDWQQTKYVTIE